MKNTLKAALTLAASAVLSVGLLAAPASAEERRTPPVANCNPGFQVTTIAGAVSCQPLPQVVVEPAPAPQPNPVQPEKPKAPKPPKSSQGYGGEAPPAEAHAPVKPGTVVTGGGVVSGGEAPTISVPAPVQVTTVEVAPVEVAPEQIGYVYTGYAGQG